MILSRKIIWKSPFQWYFLRSLISPSPWVHSTLINPKAYPFLLYYSSLFSMPCPPDCYNALSLCRQLVLRQPDLEHMTLLPLPQLTGLGQTPDPGPSSHRIKRDLWARIQMQVHHIPNCVLFVLCSTASLFWVLKLSIIRGEWIIKNNTFITEYLENKNQLK